MTPERFVQHADDAYEAIRAMNHCAINTAAIPAPEVYSVLGNLRSLAYSLSELTDHLGRGLRGSLDPAAGFDVYDNNRDPAESVDMAELALSTGTARARALGEALSAAQIAINAQGYRIPPEVKRGEQGQHHGDWYDE